MVSVQAMSGSGWAVAVRQAQPSSHGPSIGSPASATAAVRSWALKADSSATWRSAAASLAVTRAWKRRCTGPHCSSSAMVTRSAISSSVQPSCLARATNASRFSVTSS